MASASVRRPLPALIALVALLLLTGLVWWRVLHRGTSSDAATAPCPTQTTSKQLTLPAPSRVTAAVYNATTRNGLATTVRRTLLNDGFQIPKMATNAKAGTKVRASAQLRYGPRAKQSATLLRYYFPGATLMQTTSKSSTVYVVLGAKYKAVTSATSVKKALTGDKIVLSTAAPSPKPSAGASC